MLSLLLFTIRFFEISIAQEDLSTTDAEFEFIVTNKSEIWRITGKHEKHLFKTNSTAIVDVDYHYEKYVVFWIDAGKREIQSQPLNANVTYQNVIFKQDDWYPIALAVDSIADKIYVIDIKGLKIDLFDLDDKYHSILMGTDLIRPSDVKIDPYDRYLFILDGFRIIRANMDGSMSVTIVRQNINTAYGISVDVVDKKLYWVHSYYSKMKMSNYFGEEIDSYEVNVLSSMWSKFTVYEEKLFWAGKFINFKSDCKDRKIISTHSFLNSKLRMKPIYESNPIPTIRVLHSTSSNILYNPCKKYNGGCQHMCVFFTKNLVYSRNNVTRQCFCNVGWKLDKIGSPNLNCTKVRDFLIYTQPGIMKSHLTEISESSNEPYLPIAEEKNKFIDFDYHFNDNYMYYIAKNPLKNDIIYKVHPNERRPVVFSESEEHGNYQGLAVDWLTNNLYYTDPLVGAIKLIRTKNVTEKATILKNLKHPDDISVHPSRGLIFFFQTNQSTRVTTLSRAHTDGTNLTTFDSMPLKKRCGFTIDYDDERIYWYEWRKGYVYHSNLDFTDLQTVQSNFTKFVYTISIYGKWMYVATTNSEGISRVDKVTGGQAEFILSDVSNRIVKVKTFNKDTREINEHHPCIIDNGSCPYLCFGVPQSSTNISLVKVCSNDF